MDETALRIEVEMADTPTTHADVTFVDMLGDELPRLRRIARLLVGGADAADDLVAEAVARTLPKWRAGGVADPTAYLRRVMVNLAHRRWRRSLVARRHDHRALDWSQAPDDNEAVTAERDRTLQALATLPARRRAVVVLRFYDDLPEARIAEVLDIGVGTVKSTLSRALEQLRVHLAAQDQS